MHKGASDNMYGYQNEKNKRVRRKRRKRVSKSRIYCGAHIYFLVVALILSVVCFVMDLT